MNKPLLWVLSSYLRLVKWSNPLLKSSCNFEYIYSQYEPFIITFWHGRHLMGPFLRPKNRTVVAMFSRSADAELNAQLGRALGLEIVRGSGGRSTSKSPEKGGARALLQLRNALQKGKNVAMIADIPHGVRCEAGRGIVTLAKISGRPIIPFIYAFSHEKILEKTWDKMAIPLPFGRSVFYAGKPLFVAANASKEELERARNQLTQEMNKLTAEAYKQLERDKCKE